MKLNDPFNRLAKQQQNEYLTLRDTLKTAKVDSLLNAEALLADIKRRAWTFSAVIALIVFMTSIFFPEVAVTSMVIGIFTALWAITNSLKGQRYVKRYIQEEVSNEK